MFGPPSWCWPDSIVSIAVGRFPSYTRVFSGGSWIPLPTLQHFDTKMSKRDESAKLVRWAFDAGSDGSIMSSTPSSPERDSSSTLAFVSSQLVAHGFVRPPGLVGPLASLGTKDQEIVIKCLMSLLDQRLVELSIR